jgi:hypothetical protein
MCGWWLVAIPFAAAMAVSYGYRALWRGDPRREGALLSILIFVAMIIALFFYEHAFCSGIRL